MIVRDDNRILVSDSLRDVVPDLDESQIEAASAFMLIAGLELMRDDCMEVIAGKVMGLSFDTDDSIKIDIHTDLRKAYDFIKSYKTSGLSCRVLHLYIGNDEMHVEGPFKISSPKIFDFDQQMSMCTLAIDLIKN